MEPRNHGMEYQAHVHLDACLRAAQPHRAKGWLQKPQNRLRIPSVRQAARALFPRLRMAAPWAGASSDAYTDKLGKRYVTGIKLNGEGIEMWDAHRLGPQLKGGSTGSSETSSGVNKSRFHVELLRDCQVGAAITAQMARIAGGVMTAFEAFTPPKEFFPVPSQPTGVVEKPKF